MSKRVMMLGLLTLGLLLAGLAPDARATWMETTAQTANIPLTLTNWSPTTSTLVGSDPFLIQQFDAAKYQATAPPGKTVELEAVGIRLDYTFQNTISMQFTSSSTITVNASGTMSLGLGQNSSIVQDLVSPPTFANSSVMTVTTGSASHPVTVTTNPQITSSYSALAYTQSSPTVLAAFTGAGNIQLPVSATATSNFKTTSGNGLGTSITQASAMISVVYFYAYVPEPSSMVLTGLGGIGLLVVCRKRLRHQD